MRQIYIKAKGHHVLTELTSHENDSTYEDDIWQGDRLSMRR